MYNFTSMIYIRYHVIIHWSCAKWSPVLCSVFDRLLTVFLCNSSNDRTILTAGIPELDIHDVEPIIIDEINLALGTGPNGYRATFRDIEAYGVSNLTINSVRWVYKVREILHEIVWTNSSQSWWASLHSAEKTPVVQFIFTAIVEFRGVELNSENELTVPRVVLQTWAVLL